MRAGAPAVKSSATALNELRASAWSAIGSRAVLLRVEEQRWWSDSRRRCGESVGALGPTIRGVGRTVVLLLLVTGAGLVGWGVLSRADGDSNGLDALQEARLEARTARHLDVRTFSCGHELPPAARKLTLTRLDAQPTARLTRD